MDNNPELKISRQYAQAAEALFAAWTDGAQLKQWWKPMNNTLTEVIIELEPGGAVQYVFDSGLVISGNYEEVVPNEKLVYGWNWQFPKDEVKNAEYILTITFTPEGEGSSLHVLQTNFESEESMLPHKEGWEKGLDDLAAYLDNTSK